MGARRIPDPGFAGDTGDAPPELAAALRAVAADPSRRPEVLAALHGARVFAAVAAVATSTAVSTGTSGSGLTVDKEADVALALLADRRGRRAVPVFSSLATLHRFDPSARPVAVEGQRAAAVVAAEGAQDLVLDVAGPVTVTLGEREVRALLRRTPTVPAYDDEVTVASLRDVLRHEPAVRGAWLGPWPDVDARLTVALDPTADAGAVGRRLADRLQALADGAVLGVDLAIITRRPTGSPAPDGHRPVIDPLRP